MKKIVLFLICSLMVAMNASAQEIYKEVQRLENQYLDIKNDTTRSLEVRKVATFKADAIFYLRMMGSQTEDFTDYDLGTQANAMIDFVNLFVDRLSKARSNKDKELLKASFKNASIGNSLFADTDKETIYAYADNNEFITNFSLDTDWVKALEEVKAK